MKLFRYKDRDDLVEVHTKFSRGKWRWMAYEPGGKFRCVGPIKGFDTNDEALADAISLLNVAGEG